MKITRTLSDISLFSFLIVLSIGVLSCVSCSTRYSLKENPLDMQNIPEGPATPIDGVWNDGYRMQRFDKGRMYYSIENKGKYKAFGYDTYWPMVTMRDIVRVGPGRYRAMCLDPKKSGFDPDILSLPCTLTVVSSDKIIEKSQGKVISLYKRVKLDDEERFLSDLALAEQMNSSGEKESASSPVSSQGPPADRSGLSSIKVHDAFIEPAEVPQGQPFDINIIYSVRDQSTTQGSLSVRFGYKVRRGDQMIFESEPEVAASPNGQPTQRVVHLEGSIEKGLYFVEVSLMYGSLQKTRTVELHIIDRSQDQ